MNTNIYQLQDVGYQNVTLLPGHWEEQRRELIDTYLKLDNDDLLHPFRKLAGISDHAYGLSGWYGNGASTFGQILGAMARLYLATGDLRLKEKALALAEGWGECAERSRAVIDCNGTYTFDKLMTGFLDLYEYLDWKPAEDYVQQLAESAERRFDKTIPRDGLQTMPGEMIEWYTLPEQLWRAYRLFGKEVFRRMAGEWDYPYYWEKLRNGQYDKIGPRHAYSHVNALSSAAQTYIATGDTRYLEAIEAAYQEILAHHTFATGGYGPAETLFAERGYLGDSIKDTCDFSRKQLEYRDFAGRMVTRSNQWGSCEVSCCAWAVFKICNYLLKLTGEAKYGDWAEKMLINGCGGQLPITGEGDVMYYAFYSVDGAIKSTRDGRLQENGATHQWQCCTGTFPEDVAEYANMLYYRGTGKNPAAGIYVSQYLPSEYSFSVEGHRCSLTNTSMYPKEQRVQFILRMEEGTPAEKIRLFFRIPSWVREGMARTTDWIVLPIRKPDTWLEISRETLGRDLRDGDEITLELPFHLAFRPVDEDAPDVVALTYGPLTMVCDRMSLFAGEQEHPECWIRPIQKDGYSFSFETLPGHVLPYGHVTRQFYPYYEVSGMQYYYMYNRIVEEGKYPLRM